MAAPPVAVDSPPVYQDPPKENLPTINNQQPMMAVQQLPQTVGYPQQGVVYRLAYPGSANVATVQYAVSLTMNAR